MSNKRYPKLTDAQKAQVAKGVDHKQAIKEIRTYHAKTMQFVEDKFAEGGKPIFKDRARG